jgi:large subunit ribosomal protein L24e
MPRDRACDYCGADIEPGTGTMFVTTDGTTRHFCSSKCEKNADLGREPRQQAWTEAARAGAGGAEVADESDDATTDADDSETAPDLEAAETAADDADAEQADADAEDVDADAEDAEQADADDEEAQA